MMIKVFVEENNKIGGYGVMGSAVGRGGPWDRGWGVSVGTRGISVTKGKER